MKQGKFDAWLEKMMENPSPEHVHKRLCRLMQEAAGLDPNEIERLKKEKDWDGLDKLIDDALKEKSREDAGSGKDNK